MKHYRQRVSIDFGYFSISHKLLLTFPVTSCAHITLIYIGMLNKSSTCNCTLSWAYYVLCLISSRRSYLTDGATGVKLSEIEKVLLRFISLILLLFSAKESHSPC